MTYGTINDAKTIADGGTGTVLAGRYRVIRQLGQGGMGSVWLAEDTLLDNKPFAIKMLPSILVSNKRAYRQLKDEAIVAMKLVHPNIVQIRAFEENNGNPFLVMDYIDGVMLDDYLADYDSRVEHAERVEGDPDRVACPLGGLPEEEVIRILRPIAAALDYAHAKGVVHRDVKPANVMIRKDGYPFILDFGIAREIQETLTRVTGKLSSGTLLYMSPEQLNGDPPKKEQDIYSFAAMAYECLKGEPPFVRGAIEDQIKNKVPEPLVGRGVHAEPLIAGVMAGLAKKPEDRPKSCVAVLAGGGFSRVERAERVDGAGGAGGGRPPEGNGVVRRPAEPVGSRAPRDRDDAQSGGPRGRDDASQSGGPRPVAAKGILAAVLLVLLAALGGDALYYHQQQEAARREQVRIAAEQRALTEAVRKGLVGKVQLWENGPYWADRNIGAERPWECGYYFGWGDTLGYKRVGNAWVASDGSSQNFSFGAANTPTYGKTCDDLKREGWITEDGVLVPVHDAAHRHWGGSWRMPTKQELDDLKNKCDWTWTTRNGVNGYVVRGRGTYTSHSIFLPCAGYGDGTSLYDSGSHGYYWSSVSSLVYSYARYLDFYSGGHSTDGNYRFSGFSVRPVQGFTQ